MGNKPKAWALVRVNYFTPWFIFNLLVTVRRGNINFRQFSLPSWTSMLSYVLGYARSKLQSREALYIPLWCLVSSSPTEVFLHFVTDQFNFDKCFTSLLVFELSRLRSLAHDYKLCPICVAVSNICEHTQHVSSLFHKSPKQAYRVVTSKICILQPRWCEFDIRNGPALQLIDHYLDFLGYKTRRHGRHWLGSCYAQ